MVTATSLIVFLATFKFLTARGGVQRPTQGHQLGFGPSSGVDIIFPLTITQCKPVIIYYNLTVTDRAVLSAPDYYDILTLYFPAGVGYLDWICDIPTGYSLIVSGWGLLQYYTVEPGSSFACLGDLSTTYSDLIYDTTHFQSYTQHSPSGDPSSSAADQLSTIDFPTSLFPTITVNPILAVTSTITTSAASSPFSSFSAVTPTTTRSAASSLLSSPSTSSSSVSSYKSNTPVIAGGVIGGIAFVLLTITIIFVFQWKRRKSFSNSLSESATPYLKSQLGPTSPSLLPNSDSINAMRRRGKFNIHRTPVPDAPRRNHVPTHKPRYPGANLASTLDVTRLTASQRQALIASLNASANTTTPPADATQTPAALPSTSEAVQEDLPEIANILGVVSQLSPETRNALIASLSNLLMIDQMTPADLTSLPPYAE